MNIVKRFALAATVCAVVSAQAFPQGTRGGESVLAFFFDALSYAAEKPEQSRIDFYVQVPYEELRFAKEGDQFVAHYDVTLTMANAEKQALQDRSWSVDVRVPEFDQTISRKLYSLSHQSAEVEPGNYQVSVQVRDQESGAGSTIKRSLLVTNYASQSTTLSDIMLVSRLTTTAEGTNRIVPNISGNVGAEGEGFFLYCEVYGSNPDTVVTLVMKIFNREKELVRQSSLEKTIEGPRTQVFLIVDSLFVPVGTYLATIETFERGGGTPVALTSRTFNVRWLDLPYSITDLGKAVEQLRYIALPSEYEYMRDAENEEVRKARFLEFWNKRDPDPSTKRNELMEEYYGRVEYANKTFGHFTEGWKTDMGMVFIRFGAPEHVERHPFDTGSRPYEVWYYYQLQRQFIFVDEAGFGDYRLRYPTTDLWGRIR